MTEIAGAYLPGGKNRLEVHENDAGECVIVKWCSLHHQYQTAWFRRHVESPQGGYWYGRDPWGIRAHRLDKSEAMRLFALYT